MVARHGTAILLIEGMRILVILRNETRKRDRMRGKM
jgi:hypothetical protein